ncbi:MAG: FAD-dependent oxidoreductase, partial [Pseudomonadota bacterium]
IAHSEAAGVWRVEGGMHAFAQALRRLGEARGITIRMNTEVTRLEMQDGRVAAVHTRDGRLACDEAIFNGDPRALAKGLLGPVGRSAISPRPLEKRSLSANVWAFAAQAEMRGTDDLVHHNVFLCADPRTEFGPLAAHRTPEDATLYICAEDRGTGLTPPALERFEIIANAPPLEAHTPHHHPPTAKEIERCRQRTHRTLAQFGLTFDRPLPDAALTTPAAWEARFPASAGSLYGQSPHGLMAAFQRPTARTNVKGL